MRGELAKAGAGKVVCRLCRGGHFTAKCPYKDSLPVLEGTGIPTFVSILLLSSYCRLETPPFPGGDDSGAMPEAPSNSLSTGPGKYVPPSMRGGGGVGRGAGESMRGNRDDLPTLRVTNISEDTQEQV
jgi:translation initiation factor 3 subunit G